MSIYTDEGFCGRAEYLESLAEVYGVDYNKVLTAAILLGPDEDFDGLISALEDLCAS